MSEPVKRRYDATNRRERARATRREILRVAHDLFVGQGYGRTTIADIARSAGVSAETVYGAFGSKAALVRRVWDVTIGGDDEEVTFHERPEIRAIRAETDLARRFELHARMATATARRITPFARAVQAAAGADAAVAGLAEEMERQRLEGLSVMAAEAARTGQLAVSEEVCRDLVWAMTDGHLWHQLVEERGWTDEQYAAWLARVWVTTLVDPAARPGPGPGN